MLQLISFTGDNATEGDEIIIEVSLVKVDTTNETVYFYTNGTSEGKWGGGGAGVETSLLETW